MNPKVKLHFERFEIKYILPISIADKLIPAFLTHMKWDDYVDVSKNRFSYDVHSIYLDSPNFQFYREKIDGNCQRKKLRIRSYEKNINLDSIVFLEIKKRYNSVIVKDRINMKFGDCLELLRNKMNFNNLPSEKDQTVSKQFIFDILTKNLSSKVLVSYKRKPLVGKNENNLRITFDYDIESSKVKSLDFSTKTKPVLKDALIMEIKFNNILPKWLHEIIQRYNLVANSYSKYCEGLYYANLPSYIPKSYYSIS